MRIVWDLNIVDEEELTPEERARLPWNRPYEDDEYVDSGFYTVYEDDLPPREPTYHLCTDDYNDVNAGMILLEEDEAYEEPAHYEEEPDINLIYGYYEESEFI
ncbi:MAG: hypothetical protein IKE61_01195 [Coriobacteriales bacterium]|nr:hypothetical protein [Coriobacteriales bacterium]